MAQTRQYETPNGDRSRYGPAKRRASLQNCGAIVHLSHPPLGTVCNVDCSVNYPLTPSSTSHLLADAFSRYSSLFQPILVLHSSKPSILYTLLHFPFGTDWKLPTNSTFGTLLFWLALPTFSFLFWILLAISPAQASAFITIRFGGVCQGHEGR